MTFKVGGPRPPNAGRKAGTPNKRTAAIRDAIQLAAFEVGGWRRLAAWIKADPAHEKAFWTLYLRSLPRQEPERFLSPEERAHQIMARGLPPGLFDLPELFGADVPV